MLQTKCTFPLIFFCLLFPYYLPKSLPDSRGRWDSSACFVLDSRSEAILHLFLFPTTLTRSATATTSHSFLDSANTASFLTLIVFYFLPKCTSSSSFLPSIFSGTNMWPFSFCPRFCAFFMWSPPPVSCYFGFSLCATHLCTIP